MGANGQDGDDGLGGVDGLNALVETAPVPAGDDCPAGGIVARTGLDDNADGVLDADEIDSEAFVCNGMAPRAAGTRIVRTMADAEALANVNRIRGDLRILGSDLVDADFSQLQQITGDLEIEGNVALTQLDFSGLTRVGGALDLGDNLNLTDAAFGQLIFVGEHLYVGENAQLDALDLSAVEHVGGALIISTQSGAPVGQLPAFVGGDLYLGDTPGLRSLTVGDGFVGGDFTIHGNPMLSVARLTGALFVGEDVRFSANPNLSTDMALDFVLGVEGDGELIVEGNGE